MSAADKGAVEPHGFLSFEGWSWCAVCEMAEPHSNHDGFESRPDDLIGSLCALVRGAGLTMTLHGQPIDEAGLKAAALESASERTAATLVDDVMRDWHVPARHVPVALAANEDAEWHLEPDEVDP